MRCLDEYLVYERKPNGSYGAIVGKHDDLLMTRSLPASMHGFLRPGGKERVRRNLFLPEIIGKEFFETVAALDKVFVALTHFLDAVLRIVAVNDKDFQPLMIESVCYYTNANQPLYNHFLWIISKI